LYNFRRWMLSRLAWLTRSGQAWAMLRRIQNAAFGYSLQRAAALWRRSRAKPVRRRRRKSGPRYGARGRLADILVRAR